MAKSAKSKAARVGGLVSKGVPKSVAHKIAKTGKKKS